MVRVKKLKVNDFDTKNEKPVNITGELNKGIKKAKKFFKKPIVLSSKGTKTPYLIFHIRDVGLKYRLTDEEVLLFLYLNELALFETRIKVMGKSYDVKKYMEVGFIKEDFSVKQKRLFTLTDSGKDIINDFNWSLNNNERFLSENRMAQTDVENRLKVALDRLYGD